MQKVFEGVGDRLTLTDLVITYTHFHSSQWPISLKVITIASMTREILTIIPTNVLKNNATYSSNATHFMRIFAAVEASLVSFKKNG